MSLAEIRAALVKAIDDLDAIAGSTRPRGWWRPTKLGDSVTRRHPQFPPNPSPGMLYVMPNGDEYTYVVPE